MNNRTAAGIMVIIAVAVVLVGFLTMPDQRTTGERVGNAIDSLENHQGIDKAARQLEHRTPGERLGDAMKDAGQDLKDHTDRD